MIIGAMRVKNEARWIERSIASILPVCERVYVLDDFSEDGTAELARSVGENVLVWDRKKLLALDEARDKNALMQWILTEGPLLPECPWILMIDGDEVLAPSGINMLKQAAYAGYAPSYTLRVAFLWNDERTERVDGVYENLTRPSLFNTAYSNSEFRATTAGGNFHCGSVPFDLRAKSSHSGATLLHYGYMDREDRIRKFNWYNRKDPNNAREDGYRHMVIGDLLPKETVTKHAGPLTLRPIALR